MVQRSEAKMRTLIEGAVVRLGSTVRIRDEDGRVETWEVVHDGEGDLSQGRITESTPLARAVLAHGVGERVRVHGPDSHRWWVRIEAVSA
jgi:transcription elongation GreA/GreB family factor